MVSKHKVLLISTNPNSGLGGIANTVRAFIPVFQDLGVDLHHLISHDMNSSKGKWLPLFLTLFNIFWKVVTARAKKPTVWMHVGGPVSLIRKFIIGIFARFLGAEVIVHLHSASVEKLLNDRWRKCFFYCMISPAHKVVVVSDWWLSRIGGSGLGKPVYVCTNCIDVSDDGMKKQAWRQSDDKPIRVLAMSRMVQGKGFETILDGIAHCSRNFEVLMAGDGALRSSLELKTDRLGLSDCVKFIGWLDEDQKSELLQSVDIFCLPSRNDSFGMVYLEAMKAGLPIIAFDYPPVRSVVGEHAALYVKSPKELCAALEDLINDEQKRKTLGVAGRKRVAEHYSTKSLKRQIANILMN